MIKSVYILLNFLLILICSIFILLISEKLFNLKFNKIQKTIFTILFSLLFSITHKLLFIPIFILLFLQIFLLKINYINSILDSVIIFIPYFLINTIFAIQKISSIYILIPYATILLLIFTIVKIFHLTISLNNVSKSETYYIICASSLFIFYLYFDYYEIKLIQNNYILLSNILIIIFLFFYNIFIINKLEKQKIELKNLSYICDSTRTFRHDFNNIMQAMGGYIQTNDIYDLKQYYNKLVPECFRINNLYRFHSKLIVNSALYSIISDKYNLAEKNNIKMSLNILLDLNFLKIDTYTLTRILGIFLDNAIEASKECNKKIINLSFQNNDNKQSIIVENTYLNKGVSVKKIFEKHYTTKANNSGLGLWEVQKILEKNKNLNLYTKANKDFFMQQLEIS